jgi:hypothetical protein
MNVETINIRRNKIFPAGKYFILEFEYCELGFTWNLALGIWNLKTLKA